MKNTSCAITKNFKSSYKIPGYILSLTLFLGEAKYLDDIPYLPNELHGALVQTTQANAKVAHVDASEALNLSGVVTFVTAADIPGRNSFVVNAGPFPDPVSEDSDFLTVV